ncbi:glycerophosphodiester phosphodiesterase [Lysinibacillus sp. 54212]|uniref:glycerophosphodiester phosphodiesterase n=1 Tax=Lysinibacillus sp. 54212 TaxID=3119829 RepID=UPI002FCC04FB
MKIYAHRGYSARYPENTLASFRAAASYPIEGVELDVHLSKDRELVVIHDETIQRTSNGNGFVKDLTLQQLKQYDYGSWFGKKFKGEPIPTLGEVLQLFQHTKHRINVEIKTDRFVYGGIEELVLKELIKYSMLERAIISSFDHEAIKRVKKLKPEVETAALFSNIILQPSEYMKHLQADAMHVSGYYALRKPVRMALEDGFIVRVYTVNREDHALALASLGVHAIITNEVEKMVTLFQN